MNNPYVTKKTTSDDLSKNYPLANMKSKEKQAAKNAKNV